MYATRPSARIFTNGIPSTHTSNSSVGYGHLVSAEQVEIIITKYHIYLLKSGRVSLAGITDPGVDYLATAIHDVVTTVPRL